MRGLHHVGVYVSSLERSIAFYRDVFGLQVAERLDFDAEQIAFLSVGSARLELIQANPAQRSGGVVDHLALEITNLDSFVESLHERGVRMLDEAPISLPALGARILFCLGPDAERIELLEYEQPGTAFKSCLAGAFVARSGPRKLSSPEAAQPRFTP
ncbi:MAG: VOC family protein [Chloroflexota bacterium]